LIPCRDGGIQLWLDLNEHQAHMEDKIPANEEEAEKTRADNIKEYVKFLTEIWPKYF